MNKWDCLRTPTAPCSEREKYPQYVPLSPMEWCDNCVIRYLLQRLEQVTKERDDLQIARNELWTHWNTRDLACRAAEATIARLKRTLEQANALTLMLQEGDDGIHRPDRDFGQRTLHQLKCVLHAALASSEGTERQP